MKALSLVMLAVSLIVGAFFIIQDVRSDYVYEREILSYWNLADKAYTLTQKSAYLDKFVAAIEAAKLSGNNAVIFPTPDNSYEQNMLALKTLQARLHEIETMDVQSFAYQQAIQQITAQEQGEAHKMLEVFQGIYFLNHYPYLWDWYAALWIVGDLFLLFVAIVMALIAFDVDF